MEVATPKAITISSTRPSVGEALTVKFETLGLLAIARPISVSLRARRLLLVGALNSDPFLKRLLDLLLFEPRVGHHLRRDFLQREEVSFEG